jgi:hypothetical protein
LTAHEEEYRIGCSAKAERIYDELQRRESIPGLNGSSNGLANPPALKVDF